jgi:hypothetical protein
MTMPRRKPRLIPVERSEDIPEFATEAEEAHFWSTHSFGEQMLERMQPLGNDVLPTPRNRTRPRAVRFDEDVLNRLRALAIKKNTGYQTLLKTFVAERLYEEEQREGLLPRAARSRRKLKV